MRWRKRKSMRRNHGGKQQLPDCLFMLLLLSSPLFLSRTGRVIETERDEDRERERKREKETLTL